jgi:hypothetical protein
LLRNDIRLYKKVANPEIRIEQEYSSEVMRIKKAVFCYLMDSKKLGAELFLKKKGPVNCERTRTHDSGDPKTIRNETETKRMDNTEAFQIMKTLDVDWQEAGTEETRERR